ncbi:nuclear transport factor 2 family protein [Paenibacillus sp. W4I10]|uniref:nuclear transport factor 2 family protein n=1 Tax=Paenibacillus sp. W4I10 TaxID=3042298 RepID=UPI0027D81333|nr:nuclear transport factor 2 family protein [Paenibacillus sp. W4I10]
MLQNWIAPDAVFYVPMQNEPMNGPSGYLFIIHMMRSSFYDIQWTVKELVAEGDLIATHFRWASFQKISRWINRLKSKRDCILHSLFLVILQLGNINY